MTFDMVGGFSACTLLSFRTPAEAVAPMLPPGLRLVTKGEWAFWNVVACSILRMRPAGLPEWTGISYDQTACRLLVEAETRESGLVRGLYFVRSDSSSRLINIPGNLLTAFRFHTAPVRVVREGNRVRATVETGEGAARIAVRETPVPELVPGSCFESPEQARRFLKYVPNGLAPDKSGSRLHFAEVIRDEELWEERPAVVEEAEFRFFRTGAGAAAPAHLEMATIIPPIPYRWRLGRTETLPPSGAGVPPAEGPPNGR